MVAITVDDNKLDISRLFARCYWFAIYEKNNPDQIEWVFNPFKSEKEDAGIKVLNYLKIKGVSMVISGDFGLKAQKKADELNIQLVIISEDITTVKKLLEKQKQIKK
jgi:predicted Fe-Mo cluster-binding NifX family protein